MNKYDNPIISLFVSPLQLRVHGGQQDRVSGIGRLDRGGVPGESDYQLGRHSMGESTGGTLGCATGAGVNIPHGGVANYLFGVQGQYSG